MDEKCVQTFQALEVFIQTQRAALNQTLSDIERLQVLRNNFVQNCSTETLLEQVANDKALLEYEVPKPSIPGLHWSVFENHDPSALKEFASKLRQKLTERNQPHNRQRSPLSELQKLVKQQRQIIVDPVLASLEPLSEPEIESEEEVDPEELKKEREREKIRELKKCKIRSCGLKLPSFRARGASGVFIRHDLDDESMEVDISLDEGLGSRSQPTSVDIYPTITIPASSLDTPPPVSSANNSSRKRRPTARLKDTDGAADESDGKRSKKKSKKSETSIPTKPSSSSAIQSPDLSQSKKENALTKPKPETYKQAWSVSEQQLLEQLLEQIPEGEKFRWQKISRAMDGKRTPRQVASRVQKYFEKLKRYGLGPT